MRRNRQTLPIAIGAIVLVALWEIIGRTQFFGTTFPPLSKVFEVLISGQRQRLFLTAIGATASSAGLGLLIGGGIAILFAATRQAVAITRPGLDRLAAAIHAIPQIGIAPVMIIMLGRENAPIAVACIATFFPAYAAATRAFSAAASAHQDLFTALGSSRMDRLARLELPAALPGLFDALTLAAPGAVLFGALLGGWVGAFARHRWPRRRFPFFVLLAALAAPVPVGRLEAGPAPTLQRGIADAAKAEAREQGAPRLFIEAERGGERGVDREARRRGGMDVVARLVLMVVAARDRRGGRSGRLNPRGVRLARELFGHVDAQPA